MEEWRVTGFPKLADFYRCAIRRAVWFGVASFDRVSHSDVWSLALIGNDAALESRGAAVLVSSRLALTDPRTRDTLPRNALVGY